MQARAATTADEEAELLRARMITEVRRVLAKYDEHLRKQPDDAAMAIERCRFTWYAADEVGFFEGGEEEDVPDCSEELKARFPKEPAVLLFLLSNTWGEEGVRLAESILADASVAWPDSLEAQLYEDFSWKLWMTGKFPEAARAAREAVKRDGSLELSLVIAKGLELEAKRDEAISVLTKGLEHPDTARLHAKVEMLLGLGACEIAEPLFERPELADQTLLHARVLECRGETEAARRKYEQIDTGHWQRKETLLRLLDLDLRGGDPERALASYGAFRDLGWTADPFGRRRIDLAIRYPLVRWELRDTLGPLAFAVLLLGMLLLPGLVLVPVHYISLLRRSRGFSPDRTLRWKLRHVWLAAGAILVVDAVATFAFLPGSLEWEWVSEGAVPLQYSLDALGRYGAAFFAVTAVLVLAMLRRRDLAWILWNGECHPAVTIAAAGVLAGFFFVTLVVYIFVAQRMGLIELPATSLFDADRMNIFRGMRASYGILPFLAMIALVVPIYEEIVFRWVILDGFNRHIPFWSANLLQAAVFASVHMSWTLFLFFFGFAFVLGYVRRLSGGLLIGIFAHAGYNALVFLLWVVFGKI